MERGRVIVAVGIGAAAMAGIGLFVYQLCRDWERVRKEEEDEAKVPAKVIIEQPAEQTEHTVEDFGYSENAIHLEEIPIDSLSHFKPILAGHIDSAQMTSADDDDGDVHRHDVLLQYCHNNPTIVSHVGSCKILARPIGKVIFDDSSAAIVYRGDSSTGSFVDRVDRLSVLVSVLSGCLQALQQLQRHHLQFVDSDELLASVLVTSAGKAKLVGAHAIKQTVEGPSDLFIVRQVAFLCESVLTERRDGKGWTVERDQVVKLCKDLKEAKTIAAAERRLSSNAKHHR